MDEPVLLGGFSNFRLTEFRYHVSVDPYDESFIEMIASSSGNTRHLRFAQPRRLKVDEGFEGCLSGMVIKDITSRQWGGIGVEVGNLEQDPGLTFIAKSMEVLNDQAAT
jgi:hypothetical protein